MIATVIRTTRQNTTDDIRQSKGAAKDSTLALYYNGDSNLSQEGFCRIERNEKNESSYL